MSMFKKDQGKLGEDAAVVYLQKHGIKVIDRNFRIRGGEVDIIGLEGDILVFFEVKTRASSKFRTPLEAVTYWKLKALIKTAQFYKLKHPHLPDAMRIDAVSVLIENGAISSIRLDRNISEMYT